MSHIISDFQISEMHQSTSHLPSESINKDLWRHALEEHGLYDALKEYHVQKSPETKLQRQVLLEHLVSSEKNSRDDVNQQSLRITDNTRGVGSTVMHKAVDFEATSTTLKPSQMLKIGSVPYTQEYLENYYHLNTNDETSVHGELMMRDKIKWSDKNLLFTAVNSNLELWLRDSSITGYAVGAALKKIKHSMADLGVNLAQVVINGKVVFKRH